MEVFFTMSFINETPFAYRMMEELNLKATLTLADVGFDWLPTESVIFSIIK